MRHVQIDGVLEELECTRGGRSRKMDQGIERIDIEGLLMTTEQIQGDGEDKVYIKMGDRAYHLFWAGAPAKGNGI
jgi:hypothetical protein